MLIFVFFTQLTRLTNLHQNIGFLTIGSSIRIEKDLKKLYILGTRSPITRKIEHYLGALSHIRDSICDWRPSRHVTTWPASFSFIIYIIIYTIKQNIVPKIGYLSTIYYTSQIFRRQFSVIFKITFWISLKIISQHLQVRLKKILNFPKNSNEITSIPGIEIFRVQNENSKKSWKIPESEKILFKYL